MQVMLSRPEIAQKGKWKEAYSRMLTRVHRSLEWHVPFLERYSVEGEALLLALAASELLELSNTHTVSQLTLKFATEWCSEGMLCRQALQMRSRRCCSKRCCRTSKGQTILCIRVALVI